MLFSSLSGCPTCFARCSPKGAFSAAFIPMFNRKVAEGGDNSAGFIFAEQILSVLFPILVLFTLGLIVAAWPVTWVLSGGFNDPTPEQFAFAVTLSRITLPYLALISLVSLLGGILNSLDRFWVNAAAPILLNHRHDHGPVVLPRSGRLRDGTRTGDFGHGRRRASASLAGLRLASRRCAASPSHATYRR